MSPILKSSLRARQPPSRSRASRRTRTPSLGKARRLAPCLPDPRAPPAQPVLLTRVPPPVGSRPLLDKRCTPQAFTSWSDFRAVVGSPPFQRPEDLRLTIVAQSKAYNGRNTRQHSLTESPYCSVPSGTRQESLTGNPHALNSVLVHVYDDRRQHSPADGRNASSGT